jgi:Pentapeptide repeats (8 copies)
MVPTAESDDPRRNLRADCGRCFGLCCVAPAFSASADFAISKAAGHRCPNLRRADYRCCIHDDLRPRGFSGCSAYDCFGAGQHVAQVTFGGVSWQRSPAVAAQMFAAYGVMRDLHELLWYLAEAVALPAACPLVPELRRAYDETRSLTALGPDDLIAVDIDAHRRSVDPLLRGASELVRAAVPHACHDIDLGDLSRADLRGRDLWRADLAGWDLRGLDLTGANLRGACLIAADLTGADLSLADLIGADLRAADLSQARLATSMFLTQPQINAARGTGETRLPEVLERPPHWLP